MEIDKILTNLVDLHLHLGSAQPPHSLWELAHEQGIKLHEKDYWKFIDSVTIKENTTYDKYLEFFHLTELIQSSSIALEKACHSAVSYFYRKSDIRTLELRFNPMLRNKGGEQDLDKIIFSAIVGVKKACLEYPVRAGIILMMDRRFDKEKNTIIAKKAARFSNEGIIGIDLAGPLEDAFKMDDLIEATAIARDAGLKITIHTGEVTGPDEMWDVVTKLKPDRIGHGIRCIEDPKLMEHLAKENIILEVCPTSNIRTQAIKTWKDMKTTIATLKKHSVPFTINSDGPELIQTDVKHEFLKLHEEGIMTVDDIKNAIDVAHKATFISS
jgi:adenosine deaminase